MTPQAETATPASRGGNGRSVGDFAGSGIETENTLGATKTQPDRFPAGPGFKDDGAGREAAIAFGSKVRSRRQEALDGLGDEPITADELAARIGRPTYILRPRLTELGAMGFAVKAEGRGVSEFGAPATLWRRATDQERAIFLARKAVEAEHGPDAAP